MRQMMSSSVRGLLCLVFALATTAAAKSVSVDPKGYSSIGEALAKAGKGDTVWVDQGTYRESISLPAGVSLRAKQNGKAAIRGTGADKVVSLSNGCTIEGFEISGGTFGVYSSGHGNAILNCLIHGNTQSGIMCVGHLPRIEDNVVAFNEGSGLQGWDVRSTISAVAHNSFAYNGNHGISLGGNSSIVFENNIISFNQMMGVKAAPTVKATFRKNCFFGNTDIVESFPADNYSFDPLFANARKMDFRLSKDSRCHNMGTNNEDIGARFIN